MDGAALREDAEVGLVRRGHAQGQRPPQVPGRRAQGQGVEKSEARAAEWFTRAAEHGYVDSAFDLAVLYERGQGVRQDLTQAMKWYAIAAFTGDAPSQARVDFLRTQMTPDQVRLAMNAASSFSPLQALPDANSL